MNPFDLDVRIQLLGNKRDTGLKPLSGPSYTCTPVCDTVACETAAACNTDVCPYTYTTCYTCFG